VGIKKFTDVTRYFHCDVGDIFGSRFAILVKRYGLLDSSNSGEGSGERINLKPQNFFDQLTRHARPKQNAHNHRIQQVFDPSHALVAIGKRLLNSRIPFTTNGNVNVYFGSVIVNHGLSQYFGFGFRTYHV
jgi:hypothetical protein